MTQEDLNMTPIMTKSNWRAQLIRTIHHEVKRIAADSNLKGLYAQYAKLAAGIKNDKLLVLKIDGMQIRFIIIDLPDIPKIRVMN